MTGTMDTLPDFSPAVMRRRQRSDEDARDLVLAHWLRQLGVLPPLPEPACIRVQAMTTTSPLALAAARGVFLGGAA